jgi:hypothetical protein
MAAVSCADAELIAAGVEFKILRDRFVTARRQSKPCDDITDAMDPVFNRIMALPATTIEGLAVKADIVRHCYEKAFDDSFDADAPWDDSGTVRALVEAVSAFAGRSSDIVA